MAKESKSAKGQKLTIKQKKLVEALPKSNSVAEAGQKAGYYQRQNAHRALHGIAERAPEVLERLGMTIEYVAGTVLKPLLEATETKFFANAGIVLETREVPALDTRLRAVDVWAKLKGAYATQKVQFSGDLSLDLNHVSDDELDRFISKLTDPEPSKQAAEATTHSGA
jgi:hypothetical protein